MNPYTLRTHIPGDIGWIIHRHGVLYSKEYQWNGEFEALVAEVAAKFLRNYDPIRERCWIAEREGEIIGSVMLVNDGEGVAKLRLLYVEPKARGLGLGRRLVQECVAFAREAGYHTIRLWTNSILDAARHLYEEAGFALIHEAAHQAFGHALTEQTWEKRL